MNLKRLYQNKLLLPFLIVFTYGCLLLDTIKYPGFVGRHFFIDAKIYFSICVMAVLVSKKFGILSKIINKFNIFVAITSGIAYLFFSIQEASHWTNYVLSKFHFSLGGFIYLFLFSVSLIAIWNINSKTNFKASKKNIAGAVVYLFVIYTLISNFGTTFKNSLVGDIFIGLHYKYSYDQKMHSEWGNYYDYMVFVRNNTPEDATIVVPPQILPWVRVGNAHLDRYFLYPRNIVQYTNKEILDVGSLAKGTYIMIAWGDWNCDTGVCKIWPQQKIDAKEEIIKDPNSTGAKEIRENVIYDPEDTSNPYGLLRL